MYLPQYCIKKKKEVLTESMSHSFLFYHCVFFFLFSKFSQKLIPSSHVNLDGGILHYAAAAAIYSGGESSLAFGVTWMMHDSGRSWDTETVICSNAATLPHLISVQLHHPGPSPRDRSVTFTAGRDADAHDNAKTRRFLAIIQETLCSAELSSGILSRKVVVYWW